MRDLRSALRTFLVLATALFISFAFADAAERLQALIIDGQNNHDWRATTPVLEEILEGTGRFSVDVVTSPAKGESFDGWQPKFSDYDVVVSNYNGESWPEAVRKEFVGYVSGGGGFVSVHAADNAFADWPEYNEMIGVGGWRGRDEKSGPYLYWKDGEFVLDGKPGRGGSHGSQHAFEVVNRFPRHPIVEGMPERWTHTPQDELYDRLRGPAENVIVLATAYSDPATRGSGRHEPVLMLIPYGKGRVFHTVLGHSPESMKSPGFQLTLARGAEYVAGQEVTVAARGDIPNADPFHALRSYEFGDSIEPVKKIEDIVNRAHGDSGARREAEQRLLGVLQGDSTFAGKQFAVKMLNRVGSAASVPTLSKMLRDERLSDTARYALEKIDAPEAGEALMRALDELEGENRVGVVNSLGNRRMSAAVPALATLASGGEGALRRAAVGALSKIGSEAAVRALLKTGDASDPLIAHALLRIADTLADEGEVARALHIYKEVGDEPGTTDAVKTAAMRGQFLNDPDQTEALVLQLFGSVSPAMQATGADFVRQIRSKEVLSGIAAKVGELPSETAKVLLINALADQGGTAVRPQIVTLARSGAPGVRASALGALAKVPANAAAVKLLAETAAEAGNDFSDIARSALARTPGAEASTAIGRMLPVAEPAVQAELAAAAAARAMRDQVPLLARLASASESPEVRLAALGALRELAGPDDYKTLVKLLASAPDRESRTAATRAVVDVARQMEDEAARARPLVRVVSAGSMEAKEAALAVLPVLGGDTALQGVSEGLKAEGSVRAAAVRALIRWSDDAALPLLARIATGNGDETEKALTARAFIDLAGRTDSRATHETVRLYNQAWRFAPTDAMKRSVIEGLAKVPDERALELLNKIGTAGDKKWQDQADTAADAVKALLAGPPVLSASHNAGDVGKAIDGNMDTRWSTGQSMRPGMWFLIDLKTTKDISGIKLDTRPSSGDFPRGYAVQIGDDPSALGEPVTSGEGDNAVTDIRLAEPIGGRYIKITQTGAHGLYWSIHELEIDAE